MLTKQLESKITNHTAFVMILVSGSILLVCQLLRHYAFDTPAYDLRIHEELVWNSLRGRLLYSDLLGYGFLGHHASLIFVLVSPVYALWQSPVCLLVLQGVLVMLGAYFVWRFALFFHLRPVVSLALLFTFLVFRGLHSSYFRGFHQEVLAMVFLLGFLLSVYRENTPGALAWGLLSLSCREDTALFMLPVGLVLCFRRGTLLRGVVISSLAIAWFSFAYLWLIPAHSESGPMAGFERWQPYGDSIPDVALFLIRNPGELLAHVFNRNAMKIHRGLLYLPLLDLRMVFAIAMPWIAYTTSSFPQQAGLGGAYAAMFLPFAFVGAMRTLSRRLPARLLAKAPIALVFVVLLVGINFRICPLPGSLKGTRSAHQALAVLRDKHRGLSVLAQGCVVPHIGWPRTYDMVGSTRAGPASDYDIVILASAKDPWPLETRDIVRYIEAFHASTEWAHVQAGCLDVFVKKESLN